MFFHKTLANDVFVDPGWCITALSTSFMKGCYKICDDNLGNNRMMMPGVHKPLSL